MKLATVRLEASTKAVRIDGEAVTELDAPSVGDVLARDDWRAWAAAATGAQRPLAELDYAPLIPRPPKIICGGLNYRSHILESGMPVPTHPTLFAKYAPSLIGAHDDIVLPPESEMADWEAELAVIIGARGRRLSEEKAAGVIAGYAVINDISIRDWQLRTSEWMQGKTFEATTPLGPWLVTSDEAPWPQGHLACAVDGELVQEADTSDLVFSPYAMVSYISTIVTLEPGDVIATGTPGGVGIARKPQRFLRDGQVVVTTIAGLGECRNVCRTEKVP